MSYGDLCNDGTEVPVAVLGAGPVGSTLARSLAAAGTPVVIGSREPGSDRITAMVAELGADVAAAAPLEAISSCPVVLLTLPGSAAAEVIQDYADALGSKVVIDATNDLRGGHAPDSLSALGA